MLKSDCVDHTNCGKFLKEMAIPDHLTCLPRNLYAGQEPTVRTRHGTMNWFKTGKGVCQGCILTPCLFNLHTEYIRQKTNWMKHKLESRLPGETSITSDADNTTLMTENEKELRSFLRKVKEDSERAALKRNIQKMKIMASGPKILWLRDGETMGTVTEFIFLGSKITADSDCSHVIKRYLLLRRNAMTNLVSVLKSSDTTLPTKV